MRCVIAIQTCAALALGLCLAPFQHVHMDHDHAALVHSHPYALPHLHGRPNGPQIDDDDDHATVRSLDTFTLAFAPHVAPFVLPRGPVLQLISATQPEPVDVVDECAHDPPCVDHSVPRAPPA